MSDSIQLSPEGDVDSGGDAERLCKYLAVHWRYEPTLRGIVVFVFTKSAG